MYDLLSKLRALEICNYFIYYRTKFVSISFKIKRTNEVRKVIRVGKIDASFNTVLVRKETEQ